MEILVLTIRLGHPDTFSVQHQILGIFMMIKMYLKSSLTRFWFLGAKPPVLNIPIWNK
jgi:hypothetical protein